MTKPKYAIGDRIPGSPFHVRGVMTPSDGNHRYFIQVATSDNTFVGTYEDIKDASAIVQAKTKLSASKYFQKFT